MSKISKINVNGTEYDLGAGGGCDVLYSGGLELVNNYVTDGEIQYDEEYDRDTILNNVTQLFNIIKSAKEEGYKILLIDYYLDDCGIGDSFENVSINFFYDYYWCKGFILPNNEYIYNNDKFRFDISLYENNKNITISYKGDDVETDVVIQLLNNNEVHVSGEDGYYFNVDIYKIIGIK